MIINIMDFVHYLLLYKY